MVSPNIDTIVLRDKHGAIIPLQTYDEATGECTPAGTAENPIATSGEMQVDPDSFGTQGTGSSYDPPSGGSGLLGFLSGIFKEINVRLPSSLGIKTATNSLSVAPASDAVHVVAGQSAVGETPTVNPVGVSGVDGNGLKRSILTDSSGQQIVIQKFVTATRQNFSFSASSQTQAVEVPSGANSVSVEVSGAFVGQANLMYSPDSTNGADGNWYTLVGHSPGALNAQLSNVTNLSTSLKADIPVSAKYVQVSCSLLSSGTMVGLLSVGNAIYSGITTGQSLLQAGVSRAGFMPRAAIWTRESTTPVNANLSISGSAKTTFNTSSGTALNTVTSYGDKFAAAAGANVAGTLIIEASPDSGSTYYPVASVALAQVGGTGNFAAYLEIPICEATMRGRLLNGGTNQANAFLTTRMLG